MNNASFAALTAAAIAAFAAQAAQAQTVSLKAAPTLQSSSFSDAELVGAKSPMPKVRFLPASAFDLNAAAAEAQGSAVAFDKPGKRPAVAEPVLEQRRQISAAALAAMPAPEAVPEAVGTGNIQFTSTRTYPRQQDRVYPSSAVGKLFFRDSAGNSYICTGSVVRPGVVLTAGHCVHRGSGGNAGFYNSFTFVPGYSRVGLTETRPFGTWSNWQYVSTTTAWSTGGGNVPNVGDWALIVFNPDGAGRRIGDYTGYLGIQYPALIGRHVTVLGYPANLDSGTQMHRVDSMATNGGSNNGLWGSDMTGGSSGGPVILNFRQDYAGLSAATQDNAANRATSVVSWGYTSAGPQVQGGAQFNSSFATLFNQTCSAYGWAC
ncbi:trypsin-like serine peptidase [Azohydromonas lata]|uniref:trypsin-like serine peptidase n=1 Tax=Azohydromonas lata TaxID=45677 RepID=UPI000830FFF9|nr:trypsin-like peptidase domain-containing protein [Azohydromonas lata]